MSIIRVLKSRIVEAACRTDFVTFFQSAFHVLEPGSTLYLNWHHYAIAHYIELVRRGKITRLIIVGPPRTLKSHQHSAAIVIVGHRLHPDDLIGTLLRSPEPWTVQYLQTWDTARKPGEANSRSACLDTSRVPFRRAAFSSNATSAHPKTLS